MDFTELSLSEFKKVKFASNNFLQAPEMYQRYQDLGRESYLVGLKDKRGKILAAGLILGRPWHFGRKCFRVAGGWLMDYDAPNHLEVLKALTQGAKEFCRQKRAIVLTVMPKLIRAVTDQQDQLPAAPTLPAPHRSQRDAVIDTTSAVARRYTNIQSEFEQLGYKYLGEFEQLKWHYRLYLKGRQPAELFASFREGHRRQIRKAEKLGIRLRELGGDSASNSAHSSQQPTLSADDAQLFKSIVAATGERQHFQDPPADYYISMKRRFGDRVKLILAEIPVASLPEKDRPTPHSTTRQDSSTTAQDSSTTGYSNLSATPDGYLPTTAAMFLYDDGELSYLYGGSLRQYQKYGGAHLLQWSMIQEAIRKGYDHYNFYGVKPFPDNGVYVFKQGFRGHVEELVGTFALPIGLLGKLYLFRIKPLKFREVN